MGADTQSVKAIIADMVGNMPTWAARWVGGYLGLVRHAYGMMRELARHQGRKPDSVALVDAAEVVRRVYHEQGISPTFRIRVVNPQGERVTLGILSDGTEI